MSKAKVTARDIGLFRRTGEQDCNNTIDVSEIEDALGKNPTAQQIKKWLIPDAETRRELAKQLIDDDFDASEEDVMRLLDAWAGGWASTAEYIVKHHRDEDD